MDQETLDKLYEDFNVEIKPGKGSFKYVRTRHILDRMNKAFNGNWGTHIISHSIIDDEVLVLASVFVYGDNGQILAQQEGFGSAKKFVGVELGNTYKSATSKAIKSAVRNWGVALFLEEGESGESVPAYQAPKSQAMPSASPQAMPSMGMPSGKTPSATPGSIPSVGAAMAMPTSGKVDTIKVPTKLPSDVPKEEQKKEAFTELPTMTATPGKMPSMGAEAQANITPVQRVAIMSRISAKGSTFEEISQAFYADKTTSAPDSLDSMSYSDALELVSFLNSK